ncbi:MAG: hypothetical protein U9P14_03490 [Gemmatimonadota bacterium]|nr:hypothetical protein [Gemmatimonadota bacterium]
MDEKKLEQRLKKLEGEISEIRERERRLHNLVLRLAAINMAVTDIMQKKHWIKPKQFEEQVEKYLGTLDQEISENRTKRYLDKLLRDFGDSEKK